MKILRLFLCIVAMTCASVLYSTPLDGLRKSLEKVFGEQAYIEAEGVMYLDSGAGSAFRVVSDGSRYFVGMGSKKYYCDAQACYLQDDSSQEISVMEYDPDRTDILSNPLSALLDMDSRFKVKGEQYVAEGRYEVEMVPLSSGQDLKHLGIVLDGHGIPKGMTVKIQIGNTVGTLKADFTVFRYVEGVFEGGFTPNLLLLEGNGYFVNDLR